MNKEKYNQIIDEAYKNYLKNGQQEADRNKEVQTFLPMPKQMFIDKIKTDNGFSNTWGLKIEERDMTWEERVQWVMKYTDVELENLYIVEEAHKETSPTRISTIITDKERIAIYL